MGGSTQLSIDYHRCCPVKYVGVIFLRCVIRALYNIVCYWLWIKGGRGASQGRSSKIQQNSLISKFFLHISEDFTTFAAILTIHK